LDELLGRPEFPLEKLTAHYLSLLKLDALNVLTIHAELEGMKYLAWFRSFLVALKKQNVQFTNLSDIAKSAEFSVCELVQAEVEGRSGKLAWQGKTTVIV